MHQQKKVIKKKSSLNLARASYILGKKESGTLLKHDYNKYDL